MLGFGIMSSASMRLQEPPLRSALDKRGGAPRALQHVTKRSMVLGRLPLYGEPELLPDRSQASSLSAEELVVAYHERTKHHFHRFAASVGYMDWATQPDPFRRYDGASLVRLPFPEMGQALPYWQLYVADSMEPAPLSIDSIALFFRYALSLTAWKRFHETTWSLRANPSSGNLHPTEGYTLLPAVGAIHDRPGIYHYAPKEHGLERRADVDPSVWTALMAAFPEDSFLVGLSSIHWREAWKYGERAFRYCQHDVGHAPGTLRFAAAALGWKLFLLDRVDAMSQLLGLNRDADYAGAEREHPELLAVVVRGNWASEPGPLLIQRGRIPGGRFTMVWHGQRAESRAQRRLAGDRRGCCCHYESDDCDRRRFLRVSCGGGTLRAASSIRCVHREESHPGPQKRGEHGRIHRNFRGDVLPDARSSRAHPRRAIRAVGRYPMAPTHPLGPLRAPRERPFSWSLHACSRSGEGRATPASDAARVPVAAPSVVPAWTPVVPAQRRGLPRSGCERLLRSGHRGRWGVQPRDDRRLYRQPGYLRRCVLSKSLLGGRSRRPGAVPRS